MADLNNQEEGIIILEMEDDTEVECEILGVFECEEKPYIALYPIDENDENIYIYGYKEEGEEFELINIEDDAEFDKVSAEFDRLMEEAQEEE